jgi:hypothetical protein
VLAPAAGVPASSPLVLAFSAGAAPDLQPNNASANQMLAAIGGRGLREELHSPQRARTTFENCMGRV